MFKSMYRRQYHGAHPQIDVAKRYAVEESEIPQELKVVIYRIVRKPLTVYPLSGWSYVAKMIEDRCLSWGVGTIMNRYREALG